MTWKTWPLVIGMLFLCLFQESAFSQVIEERKGESNPGALIFKTTLYGVGTGLILGGAYALIEENDDVSTSEVLRWSVAIGAVGGLAVGIVYLVAGPKPKGDAEDVDVEDEEASLRMPSFRLDQRKDALGHSHYAVNMDVLKVAF